MRDRTSLVTLADVSAYVDEVIADAERGVTSYHRAASRIIGLGALDAYYDRWQHESHELERLMGIAGDAEGAFDAADCWPELVEAAARLRVAAQPRRSG